MKFQPKLRHVVTLMKVNFTFLNPWSVSQKYFSAWNYMASFLQNIIEEMQRIHELGQTYTLNKLNAHLKHDLLTDEDISRICDAVKESDLFSICHEGPMRTVYSRTQAFKKMFKYAEPVKVYLGRDETRSLRFAYYVPIKETLKCLLVSDLWQNCVAQHTHSSKPNMSQTNSLSRCIWGGKPIRLSKKPAQSTSYVFFSGQFKIKYRSRHVILCREKYLKHFDHDKVFSEIIGDLEGLEENGITGRRNS